MRREKTGSRYEPQGIMLETDIQTHLPRKTRKPHSSIFIYAEGYRATASLRVVCHLQL